MAKARKPKQKMSIDRYISRYADDVYTTPKKIAVVKASSHYDKQGRYVYTEKRKYFPKTYSNIKAAESVVGRIRQKS